MGTYAADTNVSVEKSRGEIERTLERYGASSFMYGWQGSDAVVAFEAHERRIQFVLHLPDKTERRFTHTPTRGTIRTAQQALEAWEQACRQKWRALALVVKAKLEAVDAGITTFEEEFLAHTMLPNGTRFGQWATSAVAEVYAGNRMPALMPGARS